MATDTPQIRIAISGGGVAGGSLLHALQQYPHLDVHIFESAPAFREAGVAFGIARNATAALDLIGPSARNCLVRAGGDPMTGVRFLAAQGKDQGKLVFQADSEDHASKETTTIVQRANFLRELLADIPADRMHASKKLQHIKRSDSGLELEFADGTTHACDILVGADGIHSLVRTEVLGADDPAANPRNTGSWAILTLTPFDKASQSIGTDLVDVNNAREYGWLGDGTFMMHNITDRGSLVQFSMGSFEDDVDAAGSDRVLKTLTREELDALFINRSDKPWPAHLKRAVKELLCDEPERRAFYLWEHPPARTYVNGPICVIGDAAHATTPFQGSGGGMCIEDSMILSSLLGHTTSVSDALVALTVYDTVRRPRTQRVVTSSLETGNIMTGRRPAGLDAEKLREALKSRWDFILDFDIKKQRDEALQSLDAELAKNKR